MNCGAALASAIANTTVADPGRLLEKRSTGPLSRRVRQGTDKLSPSCVGADEVWLRFYAWQALLKSSRHHSGGFFREPAAPKNRRQIEWPSLRIRAGDNRINGIGALFAPFLGRPGTPGCGLASNPAQKCWALKSSQYFRKCRKMRRASGARVHCEYEERGSIEPSGSRETDQASLRSQQP